MKSLVEISGERLAANFRAVTNVAAGAEVLAVIKADGYGHGAELCAPVLVRAGAKWLGVTDVEEGARVREALQAKGIYDTRLLVMCGMEPRDTAEMIAQKLTPVLWTVEHLAAMEAAAGAAGEVAAVHVEVDTGMARQGAAGGADLVEVLARLAASKHLRCEGVMGHLCCAEIAGAVATADARAKFGAALQQVSAAGLRPEWVHLENTSGVDEGGSAEWLRAEAAKLHAKPMVRTGIGLYGYCLAIENSEDSGGSAGKLHDAVQPVMTWTVPVIGMREIAAGTTVGYGATFVAQQPMRLALLPVGYADGFRREASSGMGNGWVMIAGERANVVGRVSMNLTVVDVTGIVSVEVGDEAVLLGAGVTADDHARWAGTIAYEILCGVRGRRVLR